MAIEVTHIIDAAKVHFRIMLLLGTGLEGKDCENMTISRIP